MSEDPLRFKAGTDLYKYAGNSPQSYSDPLGLQTRCMVAGVGKLGQRTVVCWNDGQGPSEMISGRVLPIPPKPIESEIVTAYDDYEQCKRGRPTHIGVTFQACKPSTTMDPTFSDDYGSNAEPHYELTTTADQFEAARDCLDFFPLAALDPRFDPKETIDPTSIVEAVERIFYTITPWVR